MVMDLLLAVEKRGMGEGGTERFIGGGLIGWGSSDCNQAEALCRLDSERVRGLPLPVVNRELFVLMRDCALLMLSSLMVMGLTRPVVNSEVASVSVLFISD